MSEKDREKEQDKERDESVRVCVCVCVREKEPIYSSKDPYIDKSDRKSKVKHRQK